MNTGSKRGPSLRKHRRSGGSYAKFNGQQVWFGPYDEQESHAAFAAFKARWEANGRRLPDESVREDLTVAELCAAYRDHAAIYYRRRDGSPTGEVPSIDYSLKRVEELYGTTRARAFGLADLKTVRQTMIQAGLARTTINQRVARIVRMFGWAADELMVPPETYGALRALRALKQGRSDAREPKPMRPVPQAVYEATLPHLSPTLRALVQFMWHTAARVGEAVQLRSRDVDRSGAVWMFQPAQHKLLHRDKPRIIPIGPECQAVLAPFVKLDPDAWWFSPVDALEERSRKLRAARQTPLWDSHQRRYEREKEERDPRVVGEQYRPLIVAHALRRACTAAGVTCWSAHQLRHAALSRIRREKGIEAAAAIAGHSAVGMTEHYSWEAQRTLAAQVAGEVG